jgi:HEAT repeat protein
MIDDPSARAAVAAIRLAGRSEVSADWAAASLKGAEHLLAAGERPAVIALCEEVLQGKPPAHIRRGAFGLLLRCDADDGAKRVQELLSAATPDPVLSEVALARIAEMRGEGISDTFGALLPKLQPDQQVLLVESLACRGDVRARVAIQTRVFGSDPRVRRTAIQAVGKLEGESAVPLLVNALTRSSSAEETKEIQLALASLQGADKTDQALCAALGQAAAKDKPSLMTTLARRGSASAVSSLLGYACGDDKDLAHAAMQALTRLADGGDAAALAALQQALASDDAAVRNAALRTLTAWRGSAAWDSLVGALKDPKSEGGRTLALRGLVRLAGEGNAKPDAALIGRYRQLLEVARDDGERKLILNTLAGASHPDALALALPLLDVPGVREEAVQTVKRIAEAIQKKHPKAAEEAFAKIKGLG